VIFFVSWIADAVILKEDIGRWLRERGYPDRIVKSFHGDLSPESKVDIQASFNKGEVSILCCTIAFAIGVRVNPEGVKIRNSARQSAIL